MSYITKHFGHVIQATYSTFRQITSPYKTYRDTIIWSNTARSLRWTFTVTTILACSSIVYWPVQRFVFSCILPSPWWPCHNPTTCGMQRRTPPMSLAELDAILTTGILCPRWHFNHSRIYCWIQNLPEILPNLSSVLAVVINHEGFECFPVEL